MFGGNREEEFERYFEETSKLIYNLGLRLFGNSEDAMDFAQDVYLKAYSNFDKFEGRSKFSTWLYSLGLNLGLNRIRGEKRIRIEALEKPEDLPYEDASGWDLEENASSMIVQEELRALPDTYRVPLILFFYEKMSYQEIATKLGQKEGTLKSLIHRGKALLRSKLIARGIRQ